MHFHCIGVRRSRVVPGPRCWNLAGLPTWSTAPAQSSLWSSNPHHSCQVQVRAHRKLLSVLMVPINDWKQFFRTFFSVTHNMRVLTPRYTDYIGGRFELLHENVIVTIVENDRPGQSWTAHQNQVVVDSTVAFVGGISLFFGQFERLVDTPMSHLNAPNKCGKQSDPLPAPAEQRPFQQGQSQFQYPLSDVAERFFPGSSYVNPQESGGMHTLHLLEWPFFSQGIFSDSHARLCTPRLPNSHVMVAVIGQAAEDVARSFITVWNSQELNFRSTIEGEPPARLIRLAPVNMPSMRPEMYVFCCHNLVRACQHCWLAIGRLCGNIGIAKSRDRAQLL